MSGCSSCAAAAANRSQNVSSNQNPTSSPNPIRILTNPNLWPKDFPQPIGSDNICVKTYVFKNSEKVQLFTDYVRNNLKNVPMKIDYDDNGYTMVSLTGLGRNLNRQQN